MKLLFMEPAEQWREMRDNETIFFSDFSCFFSEEDEIKNWRHPQGEPGRTLLKPDG